MNATKIKLKAVILTSFMEQMAAQGGDLTAEEQTLIDDFAVELQAAEDAGLIGEENLQDAIKELLAFVDEAFPEVL
jgi:hypothetical protein